MTDQQATMPTVTGKYHPAALLLPEMTEQEYRELIEDIREHGQREPISEDRDGLVLDGRHRLRACQELGIEPRIIRHAPPLECHELEAWKVAFVISRNLHRRHLTVQQRAAIAAELANMAHGTNRYEMKVEGSFDPSTPVTEAKPVMTIAAAAKAMRVSEKTVKRAKRTMRTDPEAHARAKAGTLGKAKRRRGRHPIREPVEPKPKSTATIGANLLAAMRQLQLDLSTAHRAMKNGRDWFNQMPPMHQKDLRALAEWLQAHLDDIRTATKPDTPEPVEELAAGGVIIRGVAPDDQWTIRGARIREARKAKGMTGKELSMMAHVAPNIVSMCERTVRTKSGGPAAGRPAYAKLEAALGIAMT